MWPKELFDEQEIFQDLLLDVVACQEGDLEVPEKVSIDWAKWFGDGSVVEQARWAIRILEKAKLPKWNSERASSQIKRRAPDDEPLLFGEWQDVFKMARLRAYDELEKTLLDAEERKFSLPQGIRLYHFLLKRRDLFIELKSMLEQGSEIAIGAKSYIMTKEENAVFLTLLGLCYYQTAGGFLRKKWWLSDLELPECFFIQGDKSVRDLVQNIVIDECCAENSERFNKFMISH